MAVKNLESLVLRGSAVLLAGKSGNPRLGSGFTAQPETPAIAISMRRPSHLGMQGSEPAERPDHADYCRVDAPVALGAGRSLRCAGVLSRSCSHRTGGTDTTNRVETFPTRVVVQRFRIGLAWCKPSGAMRSASA